MFTPLTTICPRVGTSSRNNNRRNVLLPAPECPVRNVIEPSSNCTETLRSASVPLSKRLVTSRNSIWLIGVVSRVAREQRVDEPLRFERPQVLGRLTDADEMHRQSAVVCNREQHPGLRRPVELRDDETGQTHRRVELFDLRKRVLSDAAVENQQNRMRRARVELRDHALDLREFFHQVRFRLQAARRIGDHDVHAARLTRAHRIEYHRRAVGTLCLRDRPECRFVRPSSSAARRRRHETYRPPREARPSLAP